MTERDEIMQWLQWMSDHSTIKTRDQWADILGYSKRTIDNWHSDCTIPAPALKHLKRIKDSSLHPVAVTDSLRFTLAEWNQIEAARRSLGFPDTDAGRGAFFTTVLTDYAARLPEKPSPVNPVNPVTPVRPLYAPAEIASSRLNEDVIEPDPAPIRKRLA